MEATDYGILSPLALVVTILRSRLLAIPFFRLPLTRCNGLRFFLLLLHRKAQANAQGMSTAMCCT